ncbi:MAG: hypothetical protein U1D30_02345 [Planctomycetota bacterium]
MSAPEGVPSYVSSIDVTAASPLPRSGAGSPETSSDSLFLLRELVNLCREQVHLSREQLELLRRTEDRYQRQQEAQKEEFQRWLKENPELAGFCGAAHENLRVLFGRSIAELVQYVDENQETIFDSDFVRMEMVDKYGSLLNHVSAMYSIVKRLAAAEQNGCESNNNGL